MVTSYKECLKNHAASLGGLALDGCGEFLPSHTANSLDPSSLKCAACGCHRNFHRRDSYGVANTTTTSQFPMPLRWNSSPSPGATSPNSSSAASPTPEHRFYPSAPHMLLALSTGCMRPLDENHHYRGLSDPAAVKSHDRKRARTKFTEEQKEKMCAFAEKLGWKMLRGNDERIMEEFCSETGVNRKVFKVWMHNNKHRREKGNGNDHNQH